MIGGTTSYDNNVAALLAIQAEWSRTDLAYVDRVNHIMNGGGLNDPYLLNTSSVFADGAVDTLTGGQQLDLFFIDAFDTITDLNKKGETVVTVS